MALETREEFMQKWQEISTKLLGKEVALEDIEQAGNELYDARVLAWSVAEEDLNVTAHRYFHGTSSVSLNFMTQLPIPGDVLPFLTGEYMFHQGFVAGMAHERLEDKAKATGLSSRESAVECLGERDTIIRTREELEAHLMPAPIETVQEIQGMIEEMAGALPQEPEGEGSPIIPPEGDD